MNYKYEIIMWKQNIAHPVSGKTPEFWYTLVSAQNGQTIMTSETYTRKASAKRVVDRMFEVLFKDGVAKYTDSTK